MASAVNPLSPAQTFSGEAAPPRPNQVANKEAFLTLLVAQIRHQNPLNPADGVEFLTQLAQFTQLEQTIAMRESLDAIRQAVEPPAPAAGSR